MYRTMYGVGDTVVTNFAYRFGVGGHYVHVHSNDGWHTLLDHLSRMRPLMNKPRVAIVGGRVITALQKEVMTLSNIQYRVRCWGELQRQRRAKIQLHKNTKVFRDALVHGYM